MEGTRDTTRARSHADLRRIAIALLAAGAILATLRAAGASSLYITPVVPDPDGSIARAAAAPADGMLWLSIDGHVHTDHSHDAGVFHQTMGKTPENHDTNVEGQLAEAALQGQDAATLTDHRTYDQAYDPAYRSDTLLLIDGEEWGGYPHATAWGLSENLEQGPDEGVCGVARAAPEVRAQDGIFGVAHPEDGRRACISVETLRDTPIDHLEAFRAPHTSFWAANLADGRRFAAVTGSDNHFRQLYGTDGGTGLNSAVVLARARTHAAFIEGVRAGRVFSTTRARLLRLTTTMDADNDGVFDVVTGGGVAPSAGTVRVAFRAENASGHWLQVLDEHSAIVAQHPVGLHDQTLTFDLPSTAALYRGELTAEPLQRVSGPDYLSYEDTLRLLSAPVYLSPPEPIEDGTQQAGGATPARLSDAPFAGFADAARAGDVVHAVWHERDVPSYRVVYRRSDDGGATWTPAQVVSGVLNARFPSVAADGARVTIAFEAHDGTAHAGQVFVATSPDGGATFGVPALVALDAARPELAAGGGADHLVWMSMEDGYKIRHARRAGDGEWTDPALLSSAKPWLGGMMMYAVPPAPVRHVPAAIHPVVAVSGERVAVAWEDNRQDLTPLRNGTPDDWGIFAAVSIDGGATWSADRRISPRHDRKPYNPTAGEESLEGNPARHPDLLWGAAGELYLAYQDRFPTLGATAYVQVSRDGGATFGEPVAASPISSEFSYKPKLVEDGDGLLVVWQQSDGRRWFLQRARSADGGATFGAAADVTSGTGYAGYPAPAGAAVVWTGEQAGVYGVYTARL